MFHVQCMFLFLGRVVFPDFSRLRLLVVLFSRNLNSLEQILNKSFSSCGVNRAVTQSLRWFGSRTLHLDRMALRMPYLGLPALGMPFLGLMALGARF